METTQQALKRRRLDGDVFAKDLDKELSKLKAKVRAARQRTE